MRTDIHRPSMMNPTDYVVLAVALVYQMESDTSTSGVETVCEMEEESPLWSEMGRPTSSTWNEHREDQCDHCGARLKYECVVLHKATGDIITVGRDCVSRFFNIEWSNREQLARARARRVANTAKLFTSFPDAADAINWVLNGDGAKKKLFRDIVENACGNGFEPTRAQVDCIVAGYAVSLAPITYKTGRQTITGTIVAAKAERDNFSHYESYKWHITIQQENGVRYYGTLPSALSPFDHTLIHYVKGKTITLTATIEAVDSAFATYSRPSKAAYVGLLPENVERTPDFWTGADAGEVEEVTVPAPTMPAEAQEEEYPEHVAPYMSPLPATPAKDAPESEWEAAYSSYRTARREIKAMEAGKLKSDIERHFYPVYTAFMDIYDAV